jgi:hypothetical protein
MRPPVTENEKTAPAAQPEAVQVPSGNAQRCRMRRSRKRAGMAALGVEVPLGRLADRMVEAGLLPEWSSEDRQAITAALSRMVAAWIDDHER